MTETAHPVVGPGSCGCTNPDHDPAAPDPHSANKNTASQ